MSRIVIEVQKNFSGVVEASLREPVPPGGPLTVAIPPQMLEAVRNLPRDDVTHAADREIGSALLDLLAQHPMIKGHTREQLTVAHNNEVPLYLVFINSEPGAWDVEELPWEALYATNVGFLAHDRNFSVARALHIHSDKNVWFFEPPLKVMAVLGAGGGGNPNVSGEQQWKGLFEAFENRPPEYRCLRILSCEQELIDKINGSKLAWATADHLITREKLFTDIQNFGPHILHFFCHGTAEPTPQLDIGTIPTWKGDRDDNILIEPRHLKQSADSSGNIWLVTLNACQGAVAGTEPGARSMPFARALVTAGIPAVVAMRDQIVGLMADSFTRRFYNALLGDLQTRLDTARKTGKSEVNWACGTFDARRELFKAYEGLKWAVPVVQTRLDPFDLRLFDPLGADLADGVLTASERQRLRGERMQLIEDQKLLAGRPLVQAAIAHKLQDIETRLVTRREDRHG